METDTHDEYKHDDSWSMSLPVFWKAARHSFIKDTLLDPGFTENEKTLIVCCEEGEEEYDEDFLKKTNSALLQIESKDDFKGAALKKAAMEIIPDRIIVEYNGMVGNLPDGTGISQKLGNLSDRNDNQCRNL